jgi:hypothetical protein
LPSQLGVHVQVVLVFVHVASEPYVLHQVSFAQEHVPVASHWPLGPHAPPTSHEGVQTRFAGPPDCVSVERHTVPSRQSPSFSQPGAQMPYIRSCHGT